MSTVGTADRSKDPRVMVSDAALARCVDVSRTFGSGPQAVVAVHGATCEVLPGARVAMTGASGSGKSTLLHLLAGLDLPTSGTVTWPALGARSQFRPGLISMVFQGPSLMPPLDVCENVALPLVLAGRSQVEANAQAKAALDALGIADLSTKIPDELSGGQSQRVAVARVLASEPRLILADEPTGQLDHVTGHHVISVLFEAADRLDAALVVATHDPEIADRFSTRWRARDGGLSTSPVAGPPRGAS